MLDDLLARIDAVLVESTPPSPRVSGDTRCGMSRRPRILDLFSCSGGAGEGYRRAGFEVVGIDIRKPTAYPAGKFYVADALAMQQDYVHGCWHENSSRTSLAGMLRDCLGRFDAIHASPPCQYEIAITKGTNADKVSRYQSLIGPVRTMLDKTGLPYVIECGQGTHMRRDVQLCGEMFGLRVIRHRDFELGGWSMEQPPHIKHRGRVKGWRHGVNYEGYYYAVYGRGGGKGTVAEWQQAMGIDWTTDEFELREAIPPAYTEFIGRQLIKQIGRVAA